MNRRATTLALLAAMTCALTVQSLPVAADAQCKLILVEEWKVRWVNGHILIDGAINGQPVGVMLDTGATRTIIFRSAAARLGLLARWSKSDSMQGVGGPSQLSSAYVEEFRLGQSTRKGWRMIIAGEHDVGADFAVVLGEDFFRQFDVEFDLPDNAVRLFQSRDCSGQPLAYWNEAGADQLRFESSDLQPQILVPVRLNGNAISAVLDSGASSTLVNKIVAARLGVNPDSPNVVYGGKGSGIGEELVDRWIAPFDRLEIGKEIISNPKIELAELGRATALAGLGTETPMLLGLDFLRSHRVLVAHSQRKMYFTHDGAKPPGAEKRAEAACNKDVDCGAKSDCSSRECPPSANK
jgi:predicted aspartyl protease